MRTFLALIGAAVVIGVVEGFLVGALADAGASVFWQNCVRSTFDGAIAIMIWEYFWKGHKDD